jgi:hypothetical protein
MLVRSVLIATITVGTPTLAAEQMPKSGSFITASGFKGIEQAQQTGGHTLSHGVVYGIVTEDNPLHIKTANCPYISEVSGDTVSLVGKCAWTDGATTSLSAVASRRRSLTSSEVAARAVSPAKRFLPASRKSFDQR